MGKGSSSSSTSQATTSNTTSVAADNGGIAVSGGSSYTNDFGTGAQSVVSNILDFSGGVLTAAEHIISQEQANAVQVSTNSLNTAGQIAASATNNAQLGQSSILTNPGTLTAIVAAIGLVAFLAFRKGKL